MTTTDTTREDWLAWRRQGIGASDVAAILGLSPWASPWSIWADKAGLLPPEPESEVMVAGRWLEAAIGPWFTHETGLHVAGEQTRCTHREHAHHRATVDGFAFDGPDTSECVDCEHRWLDHSVFGGCTRRGCRCTEGRDDHLTLTNALGLVEIKVTGPGRRWDEIPAHYAAQGQWQMHVTGYDRVWFAVLMGRRLDVHELARDQDDIDFMVERVDAFWADHVLSGEPPATDGHDATLRAIAAVHPDHTPGMCVEADDALRTELALLVQSKANKADAERLEKQAKAALAAALGDAEELTVAGRRALTYRQQDRTERCKACGHETKSTFRVMRPVKQKETA